jgi:5-methylcytosine-specific restriction endonuclease McrA
MFDPIPKPVKRIKDPKPLRRKTELRSFKVDAAGQPIIKPAKPRKRIPVKIDELWNATRILWFEINEPDYRGFYQCALCPELVHIDETTLDHIQNRSNHLELKYDVNNLQPAHGVCNGRKGSMSMEAYEKKYGVGGRSLGFRPA